MGKENASFSEELDAAGLALLGGGIKFNKSEKQITSASAQEISKSREVLLALAKANNGLLTVDTVISEARSVLSPLHSWFEWDDSKAAENYRKWQARVLITRCRISLETKPAQVVRAFVSLSSDQRAGGGYRLMANVLSDSQLSAQLIMEMRKKADYWVSQANLMDESIRSAVERFQKELVS
jgi:hypothetical protein